MGFAQSTVTCRDNFTNTTLSQENWSVGQSYGPTVNLKI